MKIRVTLDIEIGAARSISPMAVVDRINKLVICNNIPFHYEKPFEYFEIDDSTVVAFEITEVDRAPVGLPEGID